MKERAESAVYIIATGVVRGRRAAYAASAAADSWARLKANTQRGLRTL